MKTIWQFPLTTEPEQIVMIPPGGEFLDVQVRNGKPTLWVLVESERAPAPHKVYVFKTGADMDHLKFLDVIHLGTFQLTLGAYHVFA